MPERTAAEVLAEKLKAIASELAVSSSADWPMAVATRLAEDPAITVRTDMVVERFVVEFHMVPGPWGAPHTAEVLKHNLTTADWYDDVPSHRIIVRPYPEGQ